MIHLQLITLSGIKFDDDVYEVLLPTLEGQIGVLPGHMPLISVATNGVISVRRLPTDIDLAMEHYATNGGVIEVVDDTLRVLVDAEAAHQRALKLKAEAKDQVSLEHAQELLDRTAVRLQVAGLKHRRQQR